MKSKHFKIWISACFAKYMISNNRASPHYIRPFFSLVHLYNIIKCLVNTNDVFICKFFKYTKLFSWAFQSMSHGGGTCNVKLVCNKYLCLLYNIACCNRYVRSKQALGIFIIIHRICISNHFIFFSRECKSKLNKDNFAKNCKEKKSILNPKYNNSSNYVCLLWKKILLYFRPFLSRLNI